MKAPFLRLLLTAIFVLSASAVFAQHQHTAPKKPLSPPDSTEATIGSATIKINYSSPRVRGRIVWGGLIGFDRIWSAGAHDATRFSFSSDVTIAGSTIPAGTYAFFTIPGREKWTVIINKNYEQHLADDYDEALDVLRFEVTPEELAESKEELTYAIEGDGGDNGFISLTWDKLRIRFQVESK